MTNKFEQTYYENDAFWKEGAFGDLNEIRIQETEKFVPIDVGSIIDVGCGNGLFCNYLLSKRNDLEIMGIDRSQTALGYVKTEKQQGEISQIPFDDKSFDCVSCLEVLEHLSMRDYAKALSELTRVANKYVLISVPYNEDIENEVTQCPGCKTIFNVSLHLRSFTQEEISSLLNGYGYKCLKTKNIIPSHMYMGYEYYLKIRNFDFNKKTFFDSPVCPLCGFENEYFVKRQELKIDQLDVLKHSKDNISPLKSLLKTLWPKKKIDGYWIVALYEKNINL